MSGRQSRGDAEATCFVAPDLGLHCLLRPLRGIKTSSGEETMSNFLLPFWKGVYSKRKEFAPCFEKESTPKGKNLLRRGLVQRKEFTQAFEKGSSPKGKNSLPNAFLSE